MCKNRPTFSPMPASSSPYLLLHRLLVSEVELRPWRCRRAWREMARLIREGRFLRLRDFRNSHTTMKLMGNTMRFVMTPTYSWKWVQSNIYVSDFNVKQGKSEGFESCHWPIIGKRPIWVKIGDVLSRVNLKFDGWPWKTNGHLSFAVSSFVQHFIAIGEFKLELLSGNAQFGSNSTIFLAVWPCNLTYDLEKQ